MSYRVFHAHSREFDALGIQYTIISDNWGEIFAEVEEAWIELVINLMMARYDAHSQYSHPFFLWILKSFYDRPYLQNGIESSYALGGMLGVLDYLENNY